VIYVIPVDFAVTTPSSTVAISGLLLDHFMLLSGASSGNTNAVKLILLFTGKRVDVLFNVIPDTG
jgi:hypothetical protein